MDKPVAVFALISKKSPSGKVRYLLVSATKDFGEYTGYYYPPGGHIERGETPRSALVRELMEELGIVVAPERLLASGVNDRGELAEWWLASVVSGVITPNKGEIADARFVSRDEMDKLKVFPATRKFFADYLQRGGQRA